MLHFKIDSKCVVSQFSRGRIFRAKRLKVFGDGRPRPMKREDKAKLLLYLRTLRGSPALSRSHFDVAERLLFRFHNAASGRCFPSYKALAEASGCVVSTAQKAVAALERLGVLSWVHRLKREVVDGVLRVRRSSNGYAFSLPAAVAAAAGESAQGSPWAVSPSRVSPVSVLPAIAPAVVAPDRVSPVEAALARLGAARSAREAR